ncbi:uncharacterized protein LOC123383004 [Felis catus]|uniref:uncharacterized protein LOC123383004 n=1 Tax=Felis catus TaxID=9685 RepID=UPI001D19CB5C|nr:uncharacterized protein LOC123383004 [Felis catus]
MRLLSRFTDWKPQTTTLLKALWLLMAEAGFPFWATQSRGYRLSLEGNQEKLPSYPPLMWFTWGDPTCLASGVAANQTSRGFPSAPWVLECDRGQACNQAGPSLGALLACPERGTFLRQALSIEMLEAICRDPGDPDGERSHTPRGRRRHPSPGHLPQCCPESRGTTAVMSEANASPPHFSNSSPSAPRLLPSQSTEQVRVLNQASRCGPRLPGPSQPPTRSLPGSLTVVLTPHLAPSSPPFSSDSQPSLDRFPGITQFSLPSGADFQSPSRSLTQRPFWANRAAQTGDRPPFSRRRCSFTLH